MAGKRDNRYCLIRVALVIFARHSDKHPQRVLPGNGVKRVSGSAFNA